MPILEQRLEFKISNRQVLNKAVDVLETPVGKIQCGITAPNGQFAKAIILDPDVKELGSGTIEEISASGFYNYWNNPSLSILERKTILIGDEKTLNWCKERLRQEMETSKLAASWANAKETHVEDYFEFVVLNPGETRNISISGNNRQINFTISDYQLDGLDTKIKIQNQKKTFNLKSQSLTSAEYQKSLAARLELVQKTGIPEIVEGLPAIQIIGSQNLLSNGAKTCIAYHAANGRITLVDLGASIEELLDNGLDLERVDTIFISHLHIDHTSGLSDFLRFKAERFPNSTTNLVSSPEVLAELKKKLAQSVPYEELQSVFSTISFERLLPDGPYNFKPLNISGVTIEATRVRHSLETNGRSHTLSTRVSSNDLRYPLSFVSTGDTKLGTNYDCPTTHIIFPICQAMDRALAELMEVRGNEKLVRYFDAGGLNHGMLHASIADVDQFVKGLRQSNNVLQFAGHCPKDAPLPKTCQSITAEAHGMIITWNK